MPQPKYRDVLLPQVLADSGQRRLGLPAVVLFLFFGCGTDFCAGSISSVADIPGAILHGVQTESLWSWEAAAVVFGWTAAHFAAYLYLPGPVVEGVKLRDGTRLGDYLPNAALPSRLTLSVIVTERIVVADFDYDSDETDISRFDPDVYADAQAPWRNH